MMLYYKAFFFFLIMLQTSMVYSDRLLKNKLEVARQEGKVVKQYSTRNKWSWWHIKRSASFSKCKSQLQFSVTARKKEGYPLKMLQQ